MLTSNHLVYQTPRPDHVITFLRKEHLPPNEACFQVPLTWTKFDLRDYLWNLYDVEVKKVRSFVKEMPLARRPGTAQAWYRPQAKKIMTVELSKPFQWPAVPEDLTPWNKEMFDQRQDKIEENRQMQKTQHDMTLPLKSRQPLSENRKGLAKLAGRLLTGEVEWSNGLTLDPKWDAIMAEVEKKKKKAPVEKEAAVEAKEAEAKDATR